MCNVEWWNDMRIRWYDNENERGNMRIKCEMKWDDIR